MKLLVARTFQTLLISLVVFSSKNLFAYDEVIHQILTQRAVEISKLGADPTLMTDLGLANITNGAFTEYQYSPPVVYSTGTPLAVAIWGAYEEDNEFFTIALAHFFDPQANGGSGGGFNAAGAPVPIITLNSIPFTTNSVVWATEPAPIAAQYYSYNDATIQFYKALTSTSSDARTRAFGMVFQSLGQVVHHIQDMAQPQHVRNEGHYHTSDPESYAQDTARYEKYTTATLGSILYNNLKASWPQYIAPNFSQIASFWTSYTQNSLVSPASTVGLQGMADFTSRNYTSFRSGLYLDGRTLNVSASDATHPLPNGKNADGTNFTLQAQPSNFVSQSTGKTIVVPHSCLVGTVHDGWTGQDMKNKKLACKSGFPLLGTMGSIVSRYFSADDKLVWDDNYSVLLPRAVGFSAGIINHFFQTRLNLQRVGSTTSWNISNISPNKISGSFTIYAEDGSGTRSPIAGAIYSGDISAMSSVSITFNEPPSASTKLVLAFTGMANNESSVGGKVISYVPVTPPPLACGVPVAASGSSAGFNKTMDMGTTPGNVSIEFDAYSIPDAVIIKSQNGSHTTLATTNGLVSGSRSFSYPFNSTTLGNRFIDIQVTGNSNTGTVWTLTVSCPGQTINPVYPKVNVTFSILGAANTCTVTNTYVIDGYQSVQVTKSQPKSITLSAGPHNLAFTGQSFSGCSGSAGHPGFTDGLGSHDLSVGVGASISFGVCPTGGCGSGIPTNNPW